MQEKNRDFSFVKKNILKYLDYKNVTKYEFYQKTGISNGILSQSNGLSEENILRFLSYYNDINPTWLMTGEGEMLKHANLIKIDNTQVQIPVYQDIQVAAGSGFYNHEPQQADSLITLPDYLLKRNTKHICLRVRGDSMAPTIQDCSYVIARLLDKGDYAQINDEYIYIVVFEGRSYIKRIKNRIAQGFIVLCSDNPDKASHPNFNVDVNEIQHLWYVVWYISARMPNIHDQYYTRLQRLEDDLEIIKQRLLP